MSIEKKISTDTIYDGRIIKVYKDRVLLPNGRETHREVVIHRPAAVIIAENAEGRLLLIDQFRYAIDEQVIELPAGLIETDEQPSEAASRELQEETGWRPGKITHVAEAFASPGFTNELFHLFFAESLEEHHLQADDDEFIEAKFYTRDEVILLLREKKIRDAKTLMGVYWWLGERYV